MPSSQDGASPGLELGKLVSSRTRRVFLLLVGVWMLNIFDLLMTTQAAADGVLHEENPLGRMLLRAGPSALTVFKMGVLCLGTFVLFNFRRFRCAELASCLVLAVYTGVAFQWKLCYDVYEATMTGVRLDEEIARVDTLLRYVPIL